MENIVCRITWTDVRGNLLSAEKRISEMDIFQLLAVNFLSVSYVNIFSKR